jgi:hypothetical protein
MKAQDEQRSLAVNPLPAEVATEDDKLIPSRLLQIRKSIENIREDLNKEEELYQRLLKRAVELKIGHDEGAYLIVKEKESNREIDPALFKEQKPELFEKARQVEITAAEEKIQQQIEALSKLEVGEPGIRIGTVETLKMSEDEIALICKPRTVTRMYEVVQAGKALPKGKGIRMLQEENQ